MSEKSIVAELRRAWASGAEGAIEQAARTLSVHHAGLHREYRDFIEANPRADLKLKADLWCKQELEGPLDARPLSFHGEAVVVFEQGPLLSKKRPRSPERPVIERAAKEFEFRRPRPVKWARPAGPKPVHPLARQRPEAGLFLWLHQVAAWDLEQLRHTAWVACQRLMDRFR